jgi:hypothetical protein
MNEAEKERIMKANEEYERKKEEIRRIRKEAGRKAVETKLAKGYTFRKREDLPEEPMERKREIVKESQKKAKERAARMVESGFREPPKEKEPRFKYATEEERQEAHRKHNREWRARETAKKKAAESPELNAAVLAAGGGSVLAHLLADK